MPTNVTGVANSFNTPNFIGELFLVGQNQTPFLNMVGGLTGGKQANAFLFPISQEWNLDNGAQPAISETASLTAPQPRTYVRGQKYNTCQIFHKAVTVSYANQSQAGSLTGLQVEGSNPVRDEKAFQINANLKQIALDVEATFLNGAYQLAADAGTAAKTRGILSAIQTNVITNGTAAPITYDMVTALIKTMAESGCPFSNPVLFAPSNQIVKITNLFEKYFQADNRTVGGMAIKQIITNFASVGIVWAPYMPADQIMIADLSFVSPVFLAVPGKGFLFYEELAKTGASENGQIYGQIGLDHGVEQFHGKITGLTV